MADDKNPHAAGTPEAELWRAWRERQDAADMAIREVDWAAEKARHLSSIASAFRYAYDCYMSALSPDEIDLMAKRGRS